MLGVMWTMPDTFAAVDAPLGYDLGLSLSHPDGLGGTTLNAVGAA